MQALFILKTVMRYDIIKASWMGESELFEIALVPEFSAL